jgi:hypothetical protein
MTRIDRPRGYLLAEAVVAGAVLASAIAIAFALIAQGRADVTYTAKRAIAAQLGRQKTDEVASGITCTSVPSGGPVSAGAQFPAFTLTWTSADITGVATSNPPVPAGKLCRVTVTVDYPTATNGPDDNADGTVDGKGHVTFTRMWKVQ